eukprot:gene41260-55805_t
MSARHLTLVVACLLALTPSLAISAAATPSEKIPGQSYFGTERYVEYVAGDLPIVLTSPHGGRLKPDTIPDRTEGATDTSSNSLTAANLSSLNGMLTAAQGE